MLQCQKPSHDNNSQKIAKNASLCRLFSFFILYLISRYLDDLMEGQAEQQKKAYELLKGKQATQSSNPEFLWRMCKSMYLMAVTLGQEGDSNAKQELIFEAVDYGEKALGEFIFLEFFLKSFILTKKFCGTFFCRN